MLICVPIGILQRKEEKHEKFSSFFYVFNVHIFLSLNECICENGGGFVSDVTEEIFQESLGKWRHLG